MDFTVNRQMIVFQPQESRFSDPLLLSLHHRFLGKSEFRGLAVFYFNEADRAVVSAYHIDLAGAATKIAINDIESLFSQEYIGEILALPSRRSGTQKAPFFSSIMRITQKPECLPVDRAGTVFLDAFTVQPGRVAFVLVEKISGILHVICLHDAITFYLCQDRSSGY